MALDLNKVDTRILLDTTRRLISNTQHSRTDWISPGVVVLLSIIGVFFIYSSHAFLGADYWIRQIVWIGLGGVVYVVISRIDYKIYLENALCSTWSA